MSLLDDLNGLRSPTGLRMDGATVFVRLRARQVSDDYDPSQTVEDWSQPVEMRFRGALASSSSTRTPDVLDNRTTTVAYLTVADPTVDVQAGDRIRPDPADGRWWEVTGVPSRDVNHATGWQPTTEIQMTEWRG